MVKLSDCESLQKRVNELEKLLDIAPDLIFRLDRDLRHVFVNQRVLDATGLSREEYIGKTNRELGMPEELCDLWDKTFSAVFRDKQSQEIEFAYPATKGPIHYQMRIVPEEAPDGTVSTAVGICRDVTEHKQAGEALKASEERFRATFMESPLGIFRSTFEGRFLEVNPALAALLGYDSPESVIRGIDNIGEQVYVNSDERKKVVSDQFMTKGVTQAQIHYRRRDGSVFIANLYLRTVCDEGKPVFLEGIVEDITDRKEAEKGLRESEAKFRSLFTNSPEGIFLTNPDGLIAAANPVACAMLGYSEHELRGSGRSLVVDTTDPRLALALEERELTERFRGRELTAIRKNGERFPVEVDSVVLRNESAQSFVLMRDISERKRSEEALRESELCYRTLGETIPFGIWQTDASGACTYVSDSFLEATGMTLPEVREYGWLHLLSPEDRGPTQEHWLRCVRTGDNFEREHRFRIKDGTTRYVLAIGRPMRNEVGSITGWVGINLDITDRKKAEKSLQKAHDTLEKKVAERTAELAWKNRELMEFASVASHDLQEPLRKIQAFGEMLQQELPEDLSNPAKYCLSRIGDAATRMRKLINALLAYSRASTKVSPFERINLRQIADKVVEDLEVYMGDRQPVVKISDLPPIDGDPIQISQLLQNLIGNAIRYSKADHAAVVQVSGRKLNGTCKRSENWVELRVKDNGIGFDMQYLEKIFKPFERLHKRGEYEGTGMGLAICRKIVERHGGVITAESRPGEGSIFIVTLPMEQTGLGSNIGD